MTKAKTTTIYLDGTPIELSYYSSSAGSFAYTDAPSLGFVYHPKVDASGRLWGEEPLFDSFGEVVGIFDEIDEHGLVIAVQWGWGMLVEGPGITHTALPEVAGIVDAIPGWVVVVEGEQHWLLRRASSAG